MVARNMPAAEVDITAELVRSLLIAQHPDLADLPLTEIAHGWDNVMFRLGTDYAVRVPRRAAADELIVNEARWLRGWSDRLPIPIPEPVRTGNPTTDFPWHWNICPWFDGDVAASSTLHDPRREARRMAEFLTILHVPMPDGGPANQYRGMPLAELTPRVLANIDKLSDEIDSASCIARWHELAGVDQWDGPPLFLHGDIHTANLLVHDGAISAVIDFGDVTAGDPAVDYAFAWMLFDETSRGELREVGGLDDALWSRAEGWALHFALLYRLNSADNPLIARMGRDLMAALEIRMVDT